MKKSCRSNNAVGVWCAAFGVGLLTCAILPTKFMLVLLGAALVVCGLSCGKR